MIWITKKVNDVLKDVDDIVIAIQQLSSLVNCDVFIFIDLALRWVRDTSKVRLVYERSEGRIKEAIIYSVIIGLIENKIDFEENWWKGLVRGPY